MRSKDEIREELKQLFEDNEELFNSTIEELDSYNGYLGDDKWYYMNEIDELLFNDSITDILFRAFFGCDDTYLTDSNGRKEYSKFNPNRDYFKFDVYGNLISSDYKDYLDYLDDDFINDLLKNRLYLSLDTDINDLLDELENAEATEEE